MNAMMPAIGSGQTQNPIAPILNMFGMTSQPDDDADDLVDPSPEHPLMDDEELQGDVELSDEDKNKLVDIVTEYCGQWAPDRLLRLARWMRNTMMNRGQQILGWDESQQTYFDAWADYRNSGQMQEGDDTCIERYINQITGMLCSAFVGTMSRAVPPVSIRPENAEILADQTTSDFAQDAIRIIENINGIRRLVRRENTLLYLYGCYAKHTRVVIDGRFAGYDEEPVFGMIQSQLPDRYICPRCGHATPAQSLESRPAKCADCGAPIGPANFYPSEKKAEYGIVATKRIPRAMVRWNVYGPLAYDTDPECSSLDEVPLFKIDQEIDIGSCRRTFPKIADEISEGDPSPTTQNATVEQMDRSQSRSLGWAFTSDIPKQKPTYSQIWMSPDSFYRKSKGRKGSASTADDDFAQRMEQKFPYGLKMVMVGKKVAFVRPAELTKDLSYCVLREEQGMFPESIADVVVPFNQRFNDAMDMIDDFYNHLSAGMILIDRRRLDPRQLAGKVMASGVLNGVWTTQEGMQQPLGDAIFQMKLQMDPTLLNYPDRILQFCYLISGNMPQSFGAGTTSEVDTWRGQKAQIDQAQGRLNPIWENLKDEHAVAARNAIEALQKAHKAGLIQELFDVIDANGSAFRNNYVDLTKMQGRIRINAQPDQGLPQSPEQFRDVILTLVEQAGKGSPIADRILSLVPNQQIAMAALGTPDMVGPGEEQRSRTLQIISRLLQNDWVKTIAPNGQLVLDLPEKPNINVEDFEVAKQTVQMFMRENDDLEQSNSGGWQRLNVYFELLLQSEAQMQARLGKFEQQVMQAKVPPPDPVMQQAQQLLLQAAAQAVKENAAIGAAGPLPDGLELTPQVAANKSILDTAAKIAKTQ